MKTKWQFTKSTILLLGGISIIGGALIGAPLERVANTTLAFPQNPPTFGFKTTPALGSLKFSAPTAIVTAPGDKARLFIVEKSGRIWLVANLANPTRSVFMDLRSKVRSGGEQGLLGLAFHPDYRNNRFLYVFYTANDNAASNRLSRFEINPANPNKALSNSEVILINQADEARNHNGGDLHFGPDGYLYVSLGDEGGANDAYGNSQRIERDFFAGILRIDVDKRPGNLTPNPHAAASANYAIPPDNPFVEVTRFNGRDLIANQVRTEFWAVGLRNPWRMAFDPVTGALYAGDVGQGKKEEVVIIEKGGNYGWPFKEGTTNGPGISRAPGGFADIPPLLEYNRGSGTEQGKSITGGIVYRGSLFSQLYGAYIFADYVSGNIWALKHNGNKVLSWERLANETKISAFGVDPRQGEILMANHTSGIIKTLAPVGETGDPLPPSLAETGAFSDLAGMTPNPGIIPYSLVVPFWSDGALKQRWFSIPDVNQTIGFSANEPWRFPDGATWIKHFEMEMVRGDPASRRRLETRFIIKNPDGVFGMTYRWNREQTNAELVAEEGLDETLEIMENGTIRNQVWHYPSRSECLSCHSKIAGGSLGFRTAQLNREFDYGGVSANQLSALAGAGYFSDTMPEPTTLPKLVSPNDLSHSLSKRVRSYLAVNCAHCHVPGGSAVGFWDARWSTPVFEKGLINGSLFNSGFDSDRRVVVPNDLENSELWQRISIRGNRQMPPNSSNELDQAGMALIQEWITQGLADFGKPAQDYQDWAQSHFENSGDLMASRNADADDDGISNFIEYLIDRDPRDYNDRWQISGTVREAKFRIGFDKVPKRGIEFRLQRTSDLRDDNSWETISLPNPDIFHSESSERGEIEREIQTNESGFYRVLILEP